MPVFDDYLIVDWSASSPPATGENSVWFCHVSRQGAGIRPETVSNPSTRMEAFAHVEAILLRCASRGRRVLLGFDFALGYPAGFAQALGLRKPYWRSIWEWLHAEIRDEQVLRSINNRFEVAGRANLDLGGAFFWGIPPQAVNNPNVPPLNPGNAPHALPDLRITDVPPAQSVRKLFYRGSVGSQVLMGLPYLLRLRKHRVLGRITRVWPFETGLDVQTQARHPFVLVAEVYPALYGNQIENLREELGIEIADEAQVRFLAHHYAQQDLEGLLQASFQAPAQLPQDLMEKVLDEEGWILGVDLPEPAAQ